MKSFAAFLMLFFISVTLFTFCKKDKEFKSSEIPVLTKSNYYKIGEKYTTTVSYDQSLMSFSVGASGSNITWDFSDLNFIYSAETTDTISCILPNNTPFFNTPTVTYDTSNYCLKYDARYEMSPSGYMSQSVSDNNYMYYRINDTVLEFVGDWADNGVSEKLNYSFSDLRTNLIFPFTYGDSKTDTFQSRFESFFLGWRYQTGTITIIADGYGRLITPDNNIINNVLRIKETINCLHTSTAPEGAYSYNDTFIIYYWYSMDTEGPILEFHMESEDMIGWAYYIKKM